MTVFIYEIKRKVELTLRETAGLVNWNLPMNTNDFRVFKDVTNAIEFVVRNTDRKPINMMGRTAQITLFDQRTSEMLWQGPLRVINEAKGICKLMISSDVTADWFLQTYSYSVTVTNSDGSTHMLYVDQHEGQRGYFELCQGPCFDPQPSVEIPGDKLHLVQEEVDQQQVSYQFTSALPGTMQRNNFSGLHTTVAFFENFTGELLVQGSVEEGVPTEGEWFEIETRKYDHKSGPDNFNILANLQWVRFRLHDHYSDVDVVLDKDKGKLTKLVFRN